MKPKLVTSHLSVCHLILAHLRVTKIASKPSQRNSFTQGSAPENGIVELTRQWIKSFYLQAPSQQSLNSCIHVTHGGNKCWNVWMVSNKWEMNILDILCQHLECLPAGQQSPCLQADLAGLQIAPPAPARDFPLSSVPSSENNWLLKTSYVPSSENNDC